MSFAMKTLLLILGLLATVFIVAQLVMGQLILRGATLQKMHQHSGYTTVALVLVYVVASMSVIAKLPTREGKRG